MGSPENSGSGLKSKPVVVRMLRGDINQWKYTPDQPADLPFDFPYIVPVVGPTFNENLYLAEQAKRNEKLALSELDRLRKELERDAFEATSGAQFPDGIVPAAKAAIDTSDIYDRRRAEKIALGDRIDRIVAKVLASVAVIVLGGSFGRACVLDSQREEALAMIGAGIEEGLSEDKTYIVRCEEHEPGLPLKAVASDYLTSLNTIMSEAAIHWELDASVGTKEGYGFLDRGQDLTCFVLFQVKGSADDPAAKLE